MSKKRGLSLEEKREKMLQIFYDSQDFFLVDNELDVALIGEENGLANENGEEVGRDDEENGHQLLLDEIPYSTPDGKRHRLECYSEQVEAPMEGMTFKTWELVESYFRSYAKQQGFGIVRGASAFRQKNGKPTKERRSITLRCEMFGKKDLRVRVNGRKMKLHSIGSQGAKFATRKSKKCECPVNVYASCPQKDEDWVIKWVNLEHQGHSPKPCMSRHVSMYRHDSINAAVRKRLSYDQQVGIKLPLTHRALAAERNGLENTVFTERDLRNIIAKDKRMKIEAEGGDANGMVNYFRRMTANQEQFFHAERVDEHDRLKDIMWVDARSRVAYKDFGDVVCFDSTYITNKFHLPFANFVGLNHHGQTVLLGCALLRHENTETFEWLFTNWLTCMGGKSPEGFLTDQCAAMRKAAANVMPNSRHRWCIWHIMQKFRDKLGSYKQYEDIKRDLTEAIYDSLTVPEFQDAWQSVIKKYKLGNNEWLEGLYREQHMWVPAHLRHIFWAGMKTTQRSESINSFFDGYVQKQTSLYEFASQYFAAMEARVYAEEAADADCERNEQELVTAFPIEKEFQRLYTLSKFFEFQTECMKLVYVSLIEKRKVDAFVFENVVGDRVWRRCKVSRKDIATERTREYLVTLDTRTNHAWCPCMMFESHGIMCRHVIRVFDIHQIKKVPEKYILSRWRKDVVREHTKIKVRHRDLSKTEAVKRYDQILGEAEVLCLVGSKNDEYMDYAIDCIRAAVAKIQLKVDEAAALSHQADNDVLASTPSSVNKNSKRAIDLDNVSPPSTKKPCPSSVGGNLPPTPGVQGSTGVVGSPAAFPDVVKDPPLPKNPKHRTTDSRYKSAVELATKGKGTSKGRKKKNKDESEGTNNADASLNATLQQALTLLLQHQTNTLYQQSQQHNQHQGQSLQQQSHQQLRHQLPYYVPTYQGDTQPMQCPPHPRLLPTVANGNCPGNNFSTNPQYAPPPQPPYAVNNTTHFIINSKCTQPSQPSHHYTTTLPPPQTSHHPLPKAKGPHQITSTSAYPPGSFGGIGISDKDISGQGGTSIGYVTRTLGNASSDWAQRESMDLNETV